MASTVNKSITMTDYTWPQRPYNFAYREPEVRPCPPPAPSTWQGIPRMKPADCCHTPPKCMRDLPKPLSCGISPKMFLPPASWSGVRQSEQRANCCNPRLTIPQDSPKQLTCHALTRKTAPPLRIQRLPSSYHQISSSEGLETLNRKTACLQKQLDALHCQIQRKLCNIQADDFKFKDMTRYKYQSVLDGVNAGQIDKPTRRSLKDSRSFCEFPHLPPAYGRPHPIPFTINEDKCRCPVRSEFMDGISHDAEHLVMTSQQMRCPMRAILPDHIPEY